MNVSALQFQVPNLPAIVEAVLAETELDAARLELEVTESVLLRDRAETLETLHRLKALGVRIVMDDFGTGYSSLSNLQAFPFDKIKIDRSFVSHVTDDASARSIIRAIVGLGRSLDLPVVAEGVETEAQRLMVLEEGCPQAQDSCSERPPKTALAAPSYASLARRRWRAAQRRRGHSAPSSGHAAASDCKHDGYPAGADPARSTAPLPLEHRTLQPRPT